MRMKIQPPNLTEPLEGGNLLYDLVQMQQQDEEELRGGIYRNQLLEGFDGSGIEFKNCVFHGCQFSQCCLDNLSLTDVLLENCSFSACHLQDLAACRVTLRGCKLMGVGMTHSLLRDVSFLGCNLRYAAMGGSRLKAVLFDGCSLQESDCSEWRWKDTAFSDCDLRKAQLLHTSLNGMDLRSCELDSFRLAPQDLKGAIVTPEQAMMLAGFLGVVIRERLHFCAAALSYRLQKLFGAEDTVSAVTQTRNDVLVVVELFIQSSTVNLYVRMCFGQCVQTFWSCDDAHEFDVGSTAFLEHLDGSDSRTAGCQHWIENDDLALVDVGRKFAVVFDRLQGLWVAVKTDVTDLSSRNHRQHAVEHTDTSAQDWNERQFSAGNDFGLCQSNRSFDFNLFERQVAGSFIAHQHGYFADQFAEFLGTGVFVSQQGNLVLDEWVIKNHRSHNDRILSVLIR